MNRVIQYIAALGVIAAFAAALYFSIPSQKVQPRYGEAKHFFEPIEETPSPFRQFMWLDGQWRFRLPGEKTWQEVPVPHSWNNIPGLEGYHGSAQYSVDFEIPAEWSSGKLNIHFGAIGGAAEIRMNGVVAARYAGGFLPLDVDVTGSARPGEKNTLEMIVDNSLHAGTPEWVREEREFGGIFREVYIEYLNEIHFTDVKIETVAYDGATATVRVNARLQLGSYVDTMVFARIDRPDLTDPVTYNTTVTAGENGMTEMEWDAEIGAPDLWTPDAPAVHSLGMVAINEDGTADGVEKTFGISTWGEDKNGRLEFGRGEVALMRGVVWREQMPGGRGPVVSEKQLKEDFARIVAAGFNAVRFAHPPHPAALDLCDRMGLLAVVDVPMWRYAANEDAGLKPGVVEAMNQAFDLYDHHPSVVMIGWGVGVNAGSHSLKGLPDNSRQRYRLYDYGNDFNAFSLNADSYKELGRKLEKYLSSQLGGAAGKPVMITGFGSAGVPGIKGGVGRPGSAMNQLYLVGLFEDKAADAPMIQGWFIDSLSDYQGPYRDFRGRHYTVPRGLMTMEREPKYAYEHLAGLAEEDPQWRFESAFAARPLPKGELVILVALLIVCAAFWQGYISPGNMDLSNRGGGQMMLEFLLFGLPMIAIAALGMSFAAGSLLGPVTDPVRLAVDYAWVKHWIQPPFMRVAVLSVVQAAWLIAAAVLMSPFFGFRPMAVFELLARCTWVKLVWMLVWFVPGMAWAPAGVAVVAEVALEAKALGRGFGVSAGKAAVLVIIANAAVAALFIFGIKWAMSIL